MTSSLAKFCLANRDCQTGFCKLGECAQPAEYLDPCLPTYDKPCGDLSSSNTLRCSEVSHLCISSTEIEEIAGGTCDTNVNCKLGTFCPAVGSTEAARRCLLCRIEGRECQREEECLDGLSCYRGRCRRRVAKDGVTCKMDETVAEIPHAAYGVCVPKGHAPLTGNEGEGLGAGALYAVVGVSSAIVVILLAILLRILYVKGVFGRSSSSV